jgi:hypothetical protein
MCPHIFEDFFYAKEMMMQEHIDAIFLYFCFYAATVRSSYMGL